MADNADVVAGTGEQCLPFDERCGDGGKAVEATLMSPKGEVETLKNTIANVKSVVLVLKLIAWVILFTSVEITLTSSHLSEVKKCFCRLSLHLFPL